MRYPLALAFLALLATPAMHAAAAAEARVLEPEAVARAFEHGDALFIDPAFRVVARARTAGGEAEVHRRETDIFYVVAGEAEFVTGGSLRDARATATDEPRGNAIEGGVVHRLSPGAVIVVPAGTPHWFYQVDETFLYYVVKATGQDAAGGAK